MYRVAHATAAALALAAAISRYQVVTHQACPDLEFPPSNTNLPSTDYSSITLRRNLHPHYEQLIRNELALYPGGFLDQYVHRVICTETLGYEEIRYGGCAVGTTVWLAVGTADPTPEGDEAMRSILHAEISSIVLRKAWMTNDSIRWARAVPPGFVYAGNEFEFASSKSAVECPPTHPVPEDGFFNAYSKTTVENDFNAYASALFLGNAHLLQSTNRRVADKRQIVMSLYARLDPSMDATYFANLSR